MVYSFISLRMGQTPFQIEASSGIHVTFAGDVWCDGTLVTRFRTISIFNFLFRNFPLYAFATHICTRGLHSG